MGEQNKCANGFMRSGRNSGSGQTHAVTKQPSEEQPDKTGSSAMTAFHSGRLSNRANEFDRAFALRDSESFKSFYL